MVCWSLLFLLEYSCFLLEYLLEYSFVFCLFVLFLVFFFWSIFTSLVLQMENNLLTMREAQVQSLGRADDPLEKEMATHSIIFAWSVPRTEEPGGLQSIVLQRVGQD